MKGIARLKKWLAHPSLLPLNSGYTYSRVDFGLSQFDSNTLHCLRHCGDSEFLLDRVLKSIIREGVAQVVWYGILGTTCCSQFDSNA